MAARKRKRKVGSKYERHAAASALVAVRRGRRSTGKKRTAQFNRARAAVSNVYNPRLYTRTMRTIFVGR